MTQYVLPDNWNFILTLGWKAAVIIIDLALGKSVGSSKLKASVE